MKRILAVSMLLLAGCASAPECEQLDISIVDTRQGRVYLLDEENLGKLAKRQRDLQHGKCQLPGLQALGTGA